MIGAELKQSIKANGIRIADLAERIGIKERTIISLYIKDKVEEHYIKKIEAAGIKLHFTTSENELNEAKKEIVQLKSMVSDLKDKLIEAIERNNELLLEKGMKLIKETKEKQHKH